MRFHEHYVSDGKGGSEMVSREPWPVAFDEFVTTLAEKRYEAEVSGTVLDFSGVKMRFPTNRDSRGALMVELQSAEIVGSSYRNVWVIGETAMEVTLEGLRQIVDAVNAHVRQCFNMQAEYLGLAKGGGISLDELHEKIQTNWPGAN